MTTVKSLNEDLLYTILSKCPSSIDMWHFLLALDYELTRMINLRAFWSHIRLSSLYNKNILLSFVKHVAMYCVDLRIDNLNWMVVVDIRRLLTNFRSLVCFHSGNVSLSKSTLINDIKNLFPFLKYVHLLISLDATSTRRCSIIDDGFKDICTALNQINQLEHVSLVLQDKKGGCLSNLCAQSYFRSVCEYISNITRDYKLISIEENGYDMERRFLLNDATDDRSFGSINISLNSSLNHLVVSFRSMLNVDLILELKDSIQTKLKLQTLVIPCVPSTRNLNDILDLNQLRILDIGYVNVKDRIELTKLDDILSSCRQHSLRNLSISLSEWQSTRFVVMSKNDDNRQTTTSVFENCFDAVVESDEEDEEKQQPIPNQSSELEKISSNTIDEFSLEFLDNTQALIFQLPLNSSWLKKLTNLNLTGIHCHSIDLQQLFDSLHLLRSLSLSPCLLLYINQLECHCKTSVPYQIHSLNQNLLSLNLVSHIPNMKESCPMFLEQYKLHCIRHSSIHQYLPNHESSFQYEHLIRYTIRTILQTLDLHHLSIRIPYYDLHVDDLQIQSTNRFETLILDVKVPVTFHVKFSLLYSMNLLNALRRLILISDNNFQLTPLLLDRFRTLEIIEIISLNYHLNRSVISYLQTVLTPANYPNLNTFRLWIGSVDANHLLKHLNKTIRLTFENSKPGFIFDISIINSSSKTLLTRKTILYDHTHEIHQYFHSLTSIHSNQFSIIYPNHLNSKPLYSEYVFDK